MVQVVDLYTFNILRSFDLSMAKIMTSDDLCVIFTHVKPYEIIWQQYNQKMWPHMTSMTSKILHKPYLVIYLIKVYYYTSNYSVYIKNILRSLDLFRTLNLTSDDLHDLKFESFLNQFEWDI